MTWDNVFSWSQAGAVFCAAIALLSGYVVNKRQGAVIAALEDSTEKQKGTNLELNTKLEEQREKTANAELRVAELHQLTAPRTLKALQGNLHELLKDKPKGELTLWYKREDTEVYEFAFHVGVILEGLGWKIVQIDVIPKDGNIPNVTLEGASILSMFKGSSPPSDDAVPAEVRATGSMLGGVAIVCQSGIPMAELPTAGSALASALRKCGIGTVGRANDKLMPEQVIVVIGTRL